MPPPPLRNRLEGRADLLDAAALRYRALRYALSRVFWKDRLRRNAEVLRAAAGDQAEVEETLAGALRRAGAEGWPTDDPWVQQLFALRDTAVALAQLATRRLKAPPGQGLGVLLGDLEALLAGPRKIRPGQRWAAALELLPRSLAELRELEENAGFVEELFRRPFDPHAALPLSPEEARALGQRLPQAETSLQDVWARVERADPSLGLLRFLQRRARRAPRAEAQNGPEELLQAAFWVDVARARVRAVVEERFTPVAIGDQELLPVFAWVAAREKDPAARPPPPLSGDRAALLELAYALWKLPKNAGAVARVPGASGARPRPAALSRERRDHLQDLARRADAASPSQDAERLRDALWLFVRIRAAASGPLPKAPADRSFAALIARAW
ncbi:MAG TPA: hypothetical protein VIG99_12320 [Myxococcaceae bacterium]